MAALPLLLVVFAAGTAPTADLPSPAEARQAVARSLPFLMKSSTAWREKRKCVTCHQVPFTLWPLHEARKDGLAVDAAYLKDLTDWSLHFCTTDKDKGAFTGGFLSTMAKLVLALDTAPQTESVKKAYEFFVPLIVAKQRPDGSWKEGNFIGVQGAEREGIEVDTLWTVLALSSLEKQAGKSLTPAALAALVKSRRRGLDWLKEAKSGARTDWFAVQVLVRQQTGEAAQAENWRQELRKRQNQDGGWPFTQGGESHPLVTGECLYALGTIQDKDDLVIRRAWKYLIASQEKDGSWKALSRQALGASNTKKVSEVATHWGTGWAAVGLLRTLPRRLETDVKSKEAGR